MKVNKWTLGLAAAGLASLPGSSAAEEKPSPVLTALSSTTISGYVDTSAHWNFGTGNANVPGYLYNSPSKSDGFNLNKVKLTIDKPLDDADWAAGYRADLLFGPDANTFGTTSSALGVGTSDFAIEQAYALLRAPLGNGLDFKVGVFDSVLGYESHDSVANPNYTRSYATTLGPHTHTGVLMSYEFCDYFSAAVGVANTYGPTINDRAFTATPLVLPPPAPPGTTVGRTMVESYKTYMGAFRITAPQKMGFLAGSTLDFGIINGFNGSVAGTGAGLVQTTYYVGATVNTPVQKLKTGTFYEYFGLSEQSGSLGFSGYANDVGLYLSYQASEKLSLHGRGEYMWFSLGPFTSAVSQAANVPTSALALTATVQYDIWKNVLTRLEFRWDHAADGAPIFGGSTAGSAGSLKNSYLLAVNVIYRF